MEGKEHKLLFEYLTFNRYPERFNENDSRTLRRKIKNYKITENDMHYFHSVKYILRVKCPPDKFT